MDGMAVQQYLLNADGLCSMARFEVRIPCTEQREFITDVALPIVEGHAVSHPLPEREVLYRLDQRSILRPYPAVPRRLPLHSIATWEERGRCVFVKHRLSTCVLASTAVFQASSVHPASISIRHSHQVDRAKQSHAVLFCRRLTSMPTPINNEKPDPY